MAKKDYKMLIALSNGTTQEATFSVPVHAVRVQDYGAKGDGSTDDTAAFQAALAASRVVFVPGGTYKLSGELIVGGNCCLELSQDTVLEFTQTSGNCISLKMSASVRGNHATITVPYTFNGNVIYVSTTLDTDVLAIPPWTRWTPQWKAGRYITDLNITKANADGFLYSNTGDCYGTAVYISADSAGSVSTRSKFIWGLNFSGLRIAGGFTYGIRAQNFNDGWNHEMRIEAFLHACKISVSLEDCNNAYISASIQPRPAADDETVYATHGIQLIRSRNADLSGSRVWDWDAAHTLWAITNEHQHISMYGDCSGAIVNDFAYYSSSFDIRERIYSDTPSNLERVTIIQEPFTRWFKPIDGLPYFNQDNEYKRVALKSDLENIIQTETIEEYTNLLPTATDGAGNIFNGIGYQAGYRVNGNNGELVATNYYTATGFIPCIAQDIIRGKRFTFTSSDGYNCIVYYDRNYNWLGQMSVKAMLGSPIYFAYEETEDGFKFKLYPITGTANVAFIRLTTTKENVKSNPIITVNQEITTREEGYIADGIKIKAQYVEGLDEMFENAIGAAIGGSY